MMHEKLFKLEREAEQRVQEARDREIDLGGPGSARRASEAMDAPMLEVAKIRKMRQRLSDKQMAIDHQSNLLRRTNRNLDLPFEVKRFRGGQAETKLAGLKSDFKALEVEAEQEFFGGTPQVAEALKAEAEPFSSTMQVAEAKTNVMNDADPGESSDERRDRVRAPEPFPETDRQQARRPFDKAGSFLNETNIINMATEQWRRRTVADDGVAPHILVKPRDQDSVLDDPSHPLNRYADGDEETRRAMDQEMRRLAFAEAEKLLERKKRLEESEEVPDLRTDSGARVLREAGDAVGKAATKTPGAKQIAESVSVLEKTLKDEGYDPEDAGSIADAMLDRKFLDALQKNMHKYWREAAKDTLLDSAKGKFGGIIRDKL